MSILPGKVKWTSDDQAWVFTFVVVDERGQREIVSGETFEYAFDAKLAMRRHVQMLRNLLEGYTNEESDCAA